MSWIHEDTRTFFQKLMTPVLQMGPVPRHIALIMDGNRRYAKERGLPVKEGHLKGYIKMDECFSWCSALGVKEVTIYAFSIENFKRTPTEVANIMRFILSRITLMFHKLDKATADGTCIQFPGDWSMVPEFMKPTMAKLMMDTRHGKRFRINIALAYTGTNDIARGVEQIRSGLASGLLEASDVSQLLLQESWQLISGYPVDILLRTSGETRLSDFLLWEASHAHLEFISPLWPELSFWDVYKACFRYQVHHAAMQQKRQVKRNSLDDSEERVKKFLGGIRQKQWAVIMHEAKKIQNSNVVK